jgi:transcriptional regulator with XRE-family HTH domain
VADRSRRFHHEGVTGRKSAALEALSVAIRRRRLALGLTQEDVAFQAGLSVRHYQSLESGGLNPSYLVLRSVADALAIGISPLVMDAEPRRAEAQKSARPRRRQRPE